MVIYNYLGCDHVKNEPLKIIKTQMPKQYFNLISAIGRKDTEAITESVEEIAENVELDPFNYEHNLIDKRLNEIWTQAEVQLNSWESFIIAE